MTTAYATAGKARHTKHFPCPLCGGHEALPRGQGTRCTGWTDGDFAHCSREELAGTLPQEAGGTYCHRMVGDCRCGRAHGGPRPAPAYHAPRPQAQQPGGRTRADDWDPDVGYNYCVDGKLVFQVCRWGSGATKRIRQRQPRPEGGWWADLDGVTPILYRRDELLAAPVGAIVAVAEGEKAVEACRAAGLIATCSPMGAGKWRAVYAEDFRGRHVIVWGDPDAPGRTHAADVAASLRGIAASVHVIDVGDLGPTADGFDFFAAGGTVEELFRRALTAPRDRQDAAELRERAAALERDLTEARRQLLAERAEHQALTALLHNRELRQEIPTALAIAYDLKNRLAAGKTDDDGRVTVSLKALEATWGVAKARASAHLARLEEAGLVRDKRVSRHATPEGGYRNTMTLEPISTDPIEFLRAVGRARSPEGRGWGGRRETCPHCAADLETTGTVRVWERYCTGCGGFIDAGRAHSRRKATPEPDGQRDQDGCFDAAPGQDSATGPSTVTSSGNAPRNPEPDGQRDQDGCFDAAPGQDSATGPSTVTSSGNAPRNPEPDGQRDQDGCFDDEAGQDDAAANDAPAPTPIRGRMCETASCWAAATHKAAGRYRCGRHVAPPHDAASCPGCGGPFSAGTCWDRACGFGMACCDCGGPTGSPLRPRCRACSEACARSEAAAEPAEFATTTDGTLLCSAPGCQAELDGFAGDGRPFCDRHLATTGVTEAVR